MGCYPCVKPKTGQQQLLRCYNPKPAGPRILISITAQYLMHSVVIYYPHCMFNFSLFFARKNSHSCIRLGMHAETTQSLCTVCDLNLSQYTVLTKYKFQLKSLLLGSTLWKKLPCHILVFFPSFSEQITPLSGLTSHQRSSRPLLLPFVNDQGADVQGDCTFANSVKTWISTGQADSSGPGPGQG